MAWAEELLTELKQLQLFEHTNPLDFSRALKVTHSLTYAYKKYTMLQCPEYTLWVATNNIHICLVRP